MYKRALLIIIFCLSVSVVFCQSEKDSLLHIIETTNHDSTKVFAFLQLYDHYLRSDQQKALEYTLKAEEIALAANLPYCIAYSKYCKGIIFGKLDRFSNAKISLDSALLIFDEIGEKSMVVDVRYELADLMQIQSRLEEAVGVFLDILPLVREFEDQNQEARIHNSLGIIYEKQKQYDKALEHYQIALNLVTVLDIKPGISACLMNIGQVLLKTDQIDSALSYLRKSYTVKIATEDKLGASIVLGGIGNVYLESESYDSAEVNYQKSLALCQQVGDAREMANTEIALARVAMLKSNYRKSLQLAEPLITRVDEFSDPEFAINLHQLLANAYYGAGDAKKAYQHLQLQMTYTDSLYNNNILSVTNNLEAKYQNVQKTKEIELLQSENQLKEEQIKNRLMERNYLIGFVIAVIILFGLVYNQYRINRKSNERLLELDRFKTDFYTNISHEFRTPLSLLMAPLKEKIDSSKSEKEQKDFEMMLRNAEQLFNLINELLELSKLESGKLELTLDPTSPEDFFRLISASFESFAASKEIQYSFQYIGMGEPVLLDQQLLIKSCNNLLSNALKFTPSGGKVTFNVSSQPNELLISISDTAGGFTEEESEQIFDRFFQFPQHQKLGTGIGLALTRELIKLHNGHINVETQKGYGTIFRIALPVKVAATTDRIERPNVSATNLQEDVLEAYSGDIHEDEKLILVIEDNQDLANYLSKILESEYSVITSMNGIDGIESAKQHVPDLIVSDVMMPGKTGIEVCEELKQANETDHIPIVLLTAKTDQSSKLQGLTTGADDYINKPFDPSELKVRVANLLLQREKLREKFTRIIKLQPSELEITNPEEVFLKKIMEIVEAHLSDSEFTAEQFGFEVGLSRMQLHRKLTALTGMSTTNFIRQQRLTRASQMLTAGENVSQVAYAVGFGSLSYFTRSFKKHFGITPSDFRETHVIDDKNV